MTIPFLTVKPKSIRCKVSPRFPAQLLGGAGINVTKSNGNYTISVNLGSTNLGAVQVDTLQVNSPTPSTSPITGALTVIGGVGIGGALNVGKSSAFVSSINTPKTDGSQFLFQSGAKTAWNVYGPSAPASTFVWGNVRSVIDVEPGTTVQNYNAYDAFIWNNIPAYTTGGITYQTTIGLQTYSANTVAAASSFGANFGFTDSYDGTVGHSVASTMTGAEIDFSVYNAGSAATGLSFVTQGPQNAGPVALALVNASTASRWANGYVMQDGALANGGAGLLLGTQGSASGNSLSSGSIILNITDTSGVERHLSIQAQPNGAGNSQLAFLDGSNYGIYFIEGPTTSSPKILMAGTGSNAGTIYGSSAAGGGLNLQSTNSGSPSADYVQITAGGVNVFDCNKTASGYVTIRATNGLNMNNLPIVNVTTLTASAASFSGTPTAPTAAPGTNTTQIATTQFVTNAVSASGVTSIAGNTGAFTLSTGLANTVNALRVSLSTITASLGADVLLNNTANYFDGPSIAQGTSGTWWVSGTVTLIDTAGAAALSAKLWDGTTIIASANATNPSTGVTTISLSGSITSPAGNIKISVKDGTSTTGKILFNQSGNSKDSTISAVRIA